MTLHPLLEQMALDEFQPHRLFRGGHAQTIAAAFYPQQGHFAADESLLVSVSDGDQLVIAINKPKNIQNGTPIAVLVHGLTGCEQSKYLIRISQHLQAGGHITARVNLRGCGPGFGLAKLPYHSGRSDDVLAVIEKLKQIYPESPVDLIGFSLGANISLKLAGENPSHPQLRRVVAVSPPLDLAASTEKLSRPVNRIFNRFFVKRLIKDLQRMKEHYPDIDLSRLSPRMSIAEFDDLYTARVSGFRDAADYYQTCSSKNFLPEIKIPTLLLYSNDDPVIDHKDFQSIANRSGLDHLILNRGGHVGFLGKTKKKYRGYWMDQLVCEWLNHRK